MFFGQLNHALTLNRLQRFLDDKVFFSFTFLTHIIECLFVRAMNRCIHHFGKWDEPNFLCDCLFQLKEASGVIFVHIIFEISLKIEKSIGLRSGECGDPSTLKHRSPILSPKWLSPTHNTHLQCEGLPHPAETIALLFESFSCDQEPSRTHSAL